MGELLQSKPDGFASSLGEGAFGKEHQSEIFRKGGLLQAKRESFTVLPRAPSLRGLSPKVTGGVKLPLSGELASVCETERVFS